MRDMQQQKNRAASLLHTARTDSQLSARQLGALAGVSGSTVSRIEAGKIAPRLGTLERLLAAAGFELDFGTHAITQKDIP